MLKMFVRFEHIYFIESIIMPFTDLKEKIYNSVKFDDVLGVIKEKSLVKVRGLNYSLRAFFMLYLKEKYNTSVLYLADTVENSEKQRDDLFTISNFTPDIYLPAENYPYCSSQIDDERKGNRLLALSNLYERKTEVLLSTYRNLFERNPDHKNFKDYRLCLSTGTEYEPGNLCETLSEAGFERVSIVEHIGEFSLKGSILDIYPFASEYPVRIEFFDREPESIRFFDPADQRKVSEVNSVELFLKDAGTESKSSNVNLIDLLPENTVIIVEDCDDLEEKLGKYYNEQIVEGYYRQKAEDKLKYEEKYFSVNEILNSLKSRNSIWLSITDKDTDIKVNVKDHGSYRYDFGNFLTVLRNNEIKKYQSYILCDNPGQAERFGELLEESFLISKRIKVIVGGLHSGFIIPEVKTAVYTDHQIFGRIKRPKNFKRFKKAIPLKELKKLNYGDFVVHYDHGIGQFLGLEKITVAGSVRDVVKLMYRDSDILYVKLDHIHLLQKYSAADGILPVLSKLGGKQFKAIKERTKKSIKNIARELIEIYAKRKSAAGTVFPADSVWQTEMEASFEFEDTPDQAKATKDIKGDMENGIPMDRLVCGDVGFGKTEVAIRAAFKAVNAEKQVAILAPTTILVHQHYENFKKRLEKYPVKIDYLSRFKTKGEQSDTISRVKEGKIDILIATHRMLSADIGFNELGLLVVDEEQRFGVTHKEKIKRLKIDVGVLTLTATPIPRTLHMSLMGVRDLSLINTPPVNRLPVITEVHPYSEDIIFEGIMKEIDRGGQVFLHP